MDEEIWYGTLNGEGGLIMATDMGMINDFIQKEEEVKEQVFSGTKHHCIFEITHPNKHSECYFCKLVQDFGEDQEGADMMCESMNNFRKPDEEVWFIHRLLDQEEYDEIQEYLKQFPHGDVSNVYSPFINSVTVQSSI